MQRADLDGERARTGFPGGGRGTPGYLCNCVVCFVSVWHYFCPYLYIGVSVFMLYVLEHFCGDGHVCVAIHTASSQQMPTEHPGSIS